MIEKGTRWETVIEPDYEEEDYRKKTAGIIKTNDGAVITIRTRTRPDWNVGDVIELTRIAQ